MNKFTRKQKDFLEKIHRSFEEFSQEEMGEMFVELASRLGMEIESTEDSTSESGLQYVVYTGVEVQ